MGIAHLSNVSWIKKKKKHHKKTAATFVLRYISLLLISHVFSRCVNDPHYAFFAGVLIVHSCPWTRYQFGFIHHARFPSTYFNFVYISITFSHFWVVETIPLSTPVVLFLTSLRRPLPRFGKLAPGIFFELYCSDFISPWLLLFPEFTFFSCSIFLAFLKTRQGEHLNTI